MAYSEEPAYADMTRDEREQFLRSLDTSEVVADAINAIAEEDGTTFMKVWEYGYTPVSSADSVERRIRKYIRDTVPEDELQDEYAWGAESIRLTY